MQVIASAVARQSPDLKAQAAPAPQRIARESRNSSDSADTSAFDVNTVPQYAETRSLVIAFIHS